MKKSLLSILFILSLLQVSAQVTNVAFVGSATTSEGQQFTYKLQVSDSNGILSGYSITDIMGPDETKTLIKGTIDAKQKQLKFKETKIVSTKIKTGPESYLCFLSATLKASTHKGTTMLKGSFKGYQADGTTLCASGTLVLVSAKDVMDKLMKANIKTDSAVTKTFATEPVAEKKETIVYQKEEAIPEAQIAKVTPGSIKEIACAGSSARVTVWDARNVDGDVITITQNGKVILDKYKLNGAYKDIDISLRRNDADTIKVIAITEGSEPLNTARLKIIAGNDTHYIDASTTLDKPIWVVLKKK